MARPSVHIAFDKGSVKGVLAKINQYRTKKRADVEAVVRRYTGLIYAEARAIVPVDTGFLRSTIEQVLTSAAGGFVTHGEVTARALYAHYVEFGTYKMAAQPYLRPAFLRHQDGFIAEIRRVMSTL